MNPENPNNKVPTKVREMFASQTKKLSANMATGASRGGQTKSGKLEIAGMCTKNTTVTPLGNHRTYADSGATVHCFDFRHCFVLNSLKSGPKLTVMLTDKTSV